MSIYKLDETPDTYITAMVDEGSYVFRMYTIKGESNNSFLRDIDLRNDKLIIYGTEIQDSIREKLHTSLLLRSNAGKIFVDCNGACYINVTGKGYFYRPIQNVIFDWHPFGVFVPNSVNYALRKQQQQKDEELAAMSSQLASTKGEAVVNKDGWEVSKKETGKLKCQLSDCRKEQLDKETELQKVHSQLSVKEFELEAMKIKFELSKEELKQLQRDRVSDFNKMDIKSMELELQKVQHQLFSTNSELNSTKNMLDFSKEQLFSCEKENKDVKIKLQSLQDQVVATLSELQSTKIELAMSNKNILELESQLLCRRKENEDIVSELQKVQNELSSSNLELPLTKSRLECSHKKIIELEEQVTTGEKMQDQLSLIVNELQYIKVLLDFTAEMKEDRCSYDECYVINKAIEIVDDK